MAGQCAERLILQPQALKRVFISKGLTAALKALRHPKPESFCNLLKLALEKEVGTTRDLQN